MSTTQVQEKQIFAVDPSHSTVEFVVRHLMISKVRGRFNAFIGAVELAPGSDVPQAINATVETNSIDTREPQRDGHLKSPDFFDAENFPQMNFVSKRVEGGPGEFKVYGDLTIRGVTREVALEGEFEGRTTDPWGNERVGYSAHTKINRKDFGLAWNQALETGGVVVGDEVRIELAVEAILQK